MPQPIPLHFCLLLILLASPAVAQAPATVQPLMRPVKGEDIFRESCAACHGADGRGHGPAAQALKPSVPDLTKLAQRNGGAFPSVHVKNTINFGGDELIPAHGSRQMPMWGPMFHEIEFDRDFGRVRLENVTKYLQSIQSK